MKFGRDPLESRSPHPPSRLLHSVDLRDEVIEHLRQRWPPTGSKLRSATSTAEETSLLAQSRFDVKALDSANFRMEAIVRRIARPALLIQDNVPQVPETDYWRAKLDAASPAIGKIAAVGRIELKNHISRSWNGTGWLVRRDLIVTNAHVAADFATRGNGSWVARLNPMNQTIESRIDFREEYERDVHEEVPITQIVFVEEKGDRPDIAVLRIADAGSSRPVIDLAPATEIRPQQEVVTIGYPKNDSSVNDPELLESVFGKLVFDVKRMSPGIITAYPGTYLTHDCSTLGGNSGSTVISLETGRAVGLHFGGSYLVDNFAVPSSTIFELLARLGL